MIDDYLKAFEDFCIVTTQAMERADAKVKELEDAVADLEDRIASLEDFLSV